MKLIDWINGKTKLNKTTFDEFQNNINDGINEKFEKTDTNFKGKWNGVIPDFSTKNTTDGLLAVLTSSGKIQQRTVDSIINKYSFPYLDLVKDVKDVTIVRGFGRYNAGTKSVPSGLCIYGSALFIPAADSTSSGHTVILIGNDKDTKGRIAIASYINYEWKSWNFIQTTT